ncbi:hypothetical protein SEA_CHARGERPOWER_86 [Mycobacterium phage Chargerpower]|nr:hypothetical protein SEA_CHARGERPOWER_86 [Mycobacterium phage Chargerpower]
MTRTLTILLLSLVASGAALAALFLTTVEASATPGDLVTVDGSTFPLCALEDCSDQPNQIGVWTDPDTNQQWLSIGERSYPIER